MDSRNLSIISEEKKSFPIIFIFLLFIPIFCYFFILIKLKYLSLLLA